MLKMLSKINHKPHILIYNAMNINPIYFIYKKLNKYLINSSQILQLSAFPPSSAPLLAFYYYFFFLYS